MVKHGPFEDVRLSFLETTKKVWLALSFYQDWNSSILLGRKMEKSSPTWHYLFRSPPTHGFGVQLRPDGAVQEQIRNPGLEQMSRFWILRKITTWPPPQRKKKVFTRSLFSFTVYIVDFGRATNHTGRSHFMPFGCKDSDCTTILHQDFLDRRCLRSTGVL